MADEQWYYCMDHQAVEQLESCDSRNRLGPYATRTEAGQALDRAAQRNESWDEDPRFNDEDPDEDEDRVRADGSPID